MNQDIRKIIVYSDGACPKCVKDRHTYEKLAGKAGAYVCWTDINDQEELLHEIVIDPHKALTELHVQDENQNKLSELDAYILLMGKVPLLKPLAWLICLPLIRPLLANSGHKDNLEKARELLQVTTTVNEPNGKIATIEPAQSTFTCPDCGAVMVIVSVFTRETLIRASPWQRCAA